jgi:hypothetical protein
MEHLCYYFVNHFIRLHFTIRIYRDGHFDMQLISAYNY